MPVQCSRQVPNDGGDSSLLEGGSRVCTLGRIEIADAAWIRDITPATFGPTANAVEQRRLQSAEREIQSVTKPGHWKLQGLRITLRRQRLDRWPTRVACFEDRGGLVEGLADGIVDGRADDLHLRRTLEQI